MRATLLLATCILSGCASIHFPATHTARRAPTTRPVQPASATAEPRVEPVKLAQPATPRAAPDPGAAVPLMGFRPMRGQSTGS